MAKRKFQLTAVQEKELKAAYSQCQDGLTKIRYQAVRLYGLGYQVSEIEAISGCSRPSLMEWCRAYQHFGIAGLVDQRRGGNRAKLKPVQLEQLQDQLERYTPRQMFGADGYVGDGQFWTVPELAQLVKQKFGITYQSKTSYRTLFDRCGFSRQRPGPQYRSRNELKVLEFEQQLEKNW
jgi:transposase